MKLRGAAHGVAAFAEGIAKLTASLLLGFLYETVGARIAFGVGGAFAAAVCLTLVLLLAVSGRRAAPAS